MADAEVKIHVQADADLQKIEETQAKIQKLYKAADHYEARGGMDTAARSARAEARELERDVARWTKERAQEQRRVTQELREQQALQKVGAGRGGGLVSALSQAGAGALVADALGAVVDSMAMGESLANRGAAMGSKTAREVAVLGSIRGTSAQTAAAGWAAEDRMHELRRERPQLESDQKYDTLRSAGQGAAWGAGIGAAVGSVVPVVGTAVGALLGGAIGAAAQGVPAWLQGRHKVKASEQEEAAEAHRAGLLQEMAPRQFMEQEGGLQMDRLRQRAKRSLEGSRAAFVDDMAEQWLGTYRDIYNRTAGNDAMAKEMADLTVQNSLRDRQATAGAGLVDAKTGGAGIAAAATWAMQTPGWQEVGAKISELHGTVQRGNAELERVNLAK